MKKIILALILVFMPLSLFASWSNQPYYDRMWSDFTGGTTHTIGLRNLSDKSVTVSRISFPFYTASAWTKTVYVYTGASSTNAEYSPTLQATFTNRSFSAGQQYVELATNITLPSGYWVYVSIADPNDGVSRGYYVSDTVWADQDTWYKRGNGSRTITVSPAITLLTSDDYVNSGGFTRINFNNYAFSTSSRSLSIPFQYYYNTNQYASSSFRYILTTLSSLAFPDDPVITSSQLVSSYDTLTNATTSITAVRDGTHLLITTFWNGETGDSMQMYGSKSMTIQIATSTVIDELAFSREAVDVACDTAEGVFEIGFCRVVNALFLPSESALNKVDSFYNSLENRAPFSYATDIKDIRDELFNSTSTHSLTVQATTSIGVITFLSSSLIESVPWTGTIRTIIGFLLWLFGIEYIYYRVRNMFSMEQK